MQSFLEILTEEQRQTLSNDQKYKIALAFNNDIGDLVIKFNELIKNFFEKIEFCQHDSDYRPKQIRRNQNQQSHVINHHDINIIKNQLNEFIALHPSFCDNVFLFGEKTFKLDQYHYKDLMPNCYAVHSFRCVSKKEFDEYCEKVGIVNVNKYILPAYKNHNINNNNSFSNYMDELTSCYKYKFPTDIEIYSKEIYDGEYAEHFQLFSKFKYINILKLIDDVKIIKSLK